MRFNFRFGFYSLILVFWVILFSTFSFAGQAQAEECHAPEPWVHGYGQRMLDCNVHSRELNECFIRIQNQGCFHDAIATIIKGKKNYKAALEAAGFVCATRSQCTMRHGLQERGFNEDNINTKHFIVSIRRKANKLYIVVTNGGTDWRGVYNKPEPLLVTERFSNYIVLENNQ